MSKNEKNTKNEPQRPLCLELSDARSEILKAIEYANKKRGIPFFLLESIVTDAARQVSALANNERGSARAMYENQLEELKKTNNKDVR